jgi:extracellular elastinolytic metalloproteinase
MKKPLLFLFCLIVVYPCLTFSQNSNEPSENVTLILDYLKERKSNLSFQDKDIEQLIVTNEYFSKSTGLEHVYVNQTFEGVKIFNAISSVTIKDGGVVYFSNRFLSNIEAKVNSFSPTQSPVLAIQTLVRHFELGNVQDLIQIERDQNVYKFSDGGISQREIPIELVYVKVDESLKLAWSLIIYNKDNSHWWSARIDALSNEIIEVNDLILSCAFEKDHSETDHGTKQLDFISATSASKSMLVDGASYNVYALPTESPNHGDRQIVTNPASVMASPFGWHDVDGVSGADFTITRGNNVWAKEDFDGSNSNAGLTAEGTSSLNFNFSLDFNSSPLAYQEAAITNLFYLNNMMHDIWYSHGFDESAGNFQANNYGNLGVDDDFVFADAQDGSRFNNANFGTPPDGFNPRMQMFLWSPPGGQTSDLAIIQNGSLAGDYIVVGANFGASLTETPITSNLVAAIDTTIDFLDICEPITNAAQLTGNIAILRRGDCQFGGKVLAVENAGAVAAIIVNSLDEPPFEMDGGAVGDAVTIPSVMIGQSAGEALITALANGESIITTLLGPDITDFIDGDFDNVIIAHEYGHGISSRITGGPFTTDCLFNAEQMGEGWSDWFGLMVTMKATDTAADARGVGTFARSQPITGVGIRPRRYSPDFAINELTYGISNNTNLSQPHGIGSLWATMLWDLTWVYIDKYGFDSDLYNGDGGNNKIMKLVIEGLKLQPCSPGFVDGRDAILAADMLTTGGADQCIIWQVFAARGLGFNANQGDSNSRIDQIENFSMPSIDDPSLANCSSLSIDEFSQDSLSIYPNPTQTELSISTSKNLGNVAITLVDINGRVVLKVRKELFNTISINTSQLQSGLYILNIKGDNFNYNQKIIKN